MINNELGMQLHHRATSGEPLTPQEQQQLETWYRHQDTLEAQTLKVTQTEMDPTKLRAQIEATVKQLAIVTQQLQQITTENQILRDEIEILRQQLASRQLV